MRHAAQPPFPTLGHPGRWRRTACTTAVAVSTILAAAIDAPLHGRALERNGLQAAQEPVPLDGLVVTANRRPAPAWTVAARTTVIEGEALERAGIEYVADALRQVSSLAVVRSGSFGATTSTFLRGGESDHVLVLIDGVVVNEPGGRFDFGSMTVDGIERIEIVRGPVSALYGSDAVSGVIHVFTRRGRGAPRSNLSFRAGSFGTTQWHGGASGGTGVLSYAFSLGRNDTDGILDFNNAHRATTVTGRVQVHPDARNDVTLSLRHEAQRFHFPTDGSGALVDRNAYTFGDALAAAVDAGRTWTDAFETRLALTLHDWDSGNDDAPDGPADTLGFFGSEGLVDGRRTAADARAIWRFAGESALAAGVELEQQSMRSFSRSLSQYGSSPQSTANERWNRAAYVHVDGVRGDVALNGGVRLEDNERYGTAATWRAGFVWRPTSAHTRLYASAGTAIKEPTFAESFGSAWTAGNPDLEPERSTGFEAGLEQQIGARATVSLTAFSQDYRNLIQYTFTPPVQGGPNYHNVARANSRGLEAEAEANFGAFRVGGSYTWLRTRVDDSGFDEGPAATFVEGQRLLRRPEHAFAFNASAAVRERLTLDMGIRRVGARDDRDFATWPANPVVLPGYFVVDFGANMHLAGGGARPAVALTVRAENLLDADYEEVWGFPAAGRGVYVGGRVTLGEG